MGTPHRTLEVPLYRFDQLSEEAQAKALDSRRNSELDYQWWDAVYEDAEQIGTIMGIEIDRNRRNRTGLHIFFSGFSSQGDGACFEGSYSYKRGALKELKSPASPGHTDKETGKWVVQESNKELHDICKGLQDVQRRHFYKLEARVKQSGHYMHSNCTDIDVTHADDQYRDIGEDEGILAQLLRDFMDWIYARLEDEHDYLLSDEALKESIEANECEFEENGTIH